VAADALAILVGAIAGKHLPERFIQLAAAALFVVFGVYMLVEGFLPAVPVAAVIAIALAAVVILGGALRALPERLRPAVMRPEPVPLSDLPRADADSCVSDAVSCDSASAREKR
jgi:Ca2+/H+ antiporter, TMEM165/GDT1 family